MGFLELFEVASMPIVQVLIISFVGALVATESVNILHSDARRHMNKAVFVVFTPSLVFSSLAKTVTLSDIVSWWYMIVNIGVAFLFGAILGWIVVKLLKPQPHLEGLVVAACSSGNLGFLMLIIVPAVCGESNSPFGDSSICATNGLSYASLSMALGGIYIWTYAYHLVQSSAARYKAMKAEEEILREANKDLNADERSHLLDDDDDGSLVQGQHVTDIAAVPSSRQQEDTEAQVIIVSERSGSERKGENEGSSFSGRFRGHLHQILEELMSPPTISAVAGFIFGSVSWLKHLLIGDTAPLRVVEDTIKLLGDGAIPCAILIQGANLIQGLRKGEVKPKIVVAVIVVKGVLLPAIGVASVHVASKFRLIPPDPLFHFILMIQFAMPPANSLMTMTQLTEVAQEECAVILLWTYMASALTVTVWTTLSMWSLS